MRFSETEKKSLQLLLLGIIAFALYFPILNNEFLSDDYDSLYRICIEHVIIVKEFLRPLIDVSFYVNYLISGLNPVSFYILNVLLHVLNAFLLFNFAKSFLKHASENKNLFAWISTILFLTYPFHNESVVWLTGRLSSIACFFSLLTLNIVTSNLKNNLKILFSMLCYIAGLLAYESILFLPFILLALQWNKTSGRQKNGSYFLGGVFISGVYLVFRYYISGSLYGNYGERMVDKGGIIHYAEMALKTLGRVMLPPSENSGMMILVFACLILLLLIIHILIFTGKIKGQPAFDQLLKLEIAFFLSMIIPMLFGVSTRTSEGDRLLYFPSVFYCMLIGYLIVNYVPALKMKLMILTMICSIYVYFLFQNNKRWEEASHLSARILSIARDTKEKKVIFINLPDELDGAFVFRNGFKKALLLNNIDTAKVEINNYLTRLKYLKSGEEIAATYSDSSTFIPPYTRIVERSDNIIRLINIETGVEKNVDRTNSVFFYWNKKEMVKLF
jgi:hypothetical protein